MPEVHEAQAFTGTAAEPLAELNDLLRLSGRVVRVEDRLSKQTSRRVGIARWYLTVRPVPEAADPWRIPVQSSADLRNTGYLNRWADCWGRDPGLPLLTAEDGRTALRLMHEVVEAWQAVNNRNDTGTDININTEEVAG